MTKGELIKMVEQLKNKQSDMKKILRNEPLIENCATIQRQIKVIDSINDRLIFNWNNLPEAKEFFNNTIAEAELFLFND